MVAMRTFLLATGFAVLLAPREAVAQAIDSLVSLQSELYPAASDTSKEGRHIAFNVIRVNALLPLQVGERTFLLPGLKYEHTNVMLQGDPEIPSPVLRTAQVSMGIAHSIGEHFTLIGTLGAGIASDLSQPITMRDLVVSATALALYNVRGALSIGAGVTYDQRTGTPLPLPALLLNWRPTQDFRVRGLVPARVDAEYRFTRWFEVGAFAMFNGDRYALGERTYGRSNLQIAFSTAEMGPKITFSANDWVHVDLWTALPVYRRYDVYQDGRNIDSVSMKLVPAYGVKMRLGPSLWDAPR
jgi:hypothetical protein